MTDKDKIEMTVKSVMEPRRYQLEIFELCRKENCLVCLKTGAGKTFVAVMLIKDKAQEIKGEYGDNSDWKRTIFLVPSVPLVSQQAEVVEKLTPLRVKGFTGDMNVDSWDRNIWKSHFNSLDVLVMTPQILLNLLLCAYISKSNINLLIFDECHNAVKNHPYCQIMDFKSKDPPHILGLSASMVNRVIGGNKLDAVDELLEEELQSYETLFNARCVTCNDSNEVLDYTGKPVEHILCYNSAANLNEMDQKLATLHEEVTKKLGNVMIIEGNFDMLKQAKSVCRQLLRIFEDTGVIGMYIAANKFKSRIGAQINQFQNDDELIWLKLVVSLLDHVIGLYEIFAIEMFGAIKDVPYRQPYISDKVYVFVNQLVDWVKEDLSCLCFVKMRCKAVVLSDLLNAMNLKRKKDATPIYSNYILGHATDMKIELTDISMKASRQRKIVTEFSLSKFAVLFSTSVIEEGIDIKRCNLVIRYDGLTQYREYIQSKGRARRKDSTFLMFSSEIDQDQSKNNLKVMHKMEESLAKTCLKRDISQLDDYQPDYDIEPYIPFDEESGPRITQYSSISQLNNYCSVIMRASNYPPRFEFEKVDEKGSQITFTCTVILPVNCPLKETIVGDSMANRDLAKQSAALLACKLLHSIGELNEHLLPHRPDNLTDDRDADDVNDEINGIPIPGTQKRTRLYDEWIPKCLYMDLKCSSVFVYRIKMHLNENSESTRRLPWRQKKLNCFAILSDEEMPQIPLYPVFNKDGVVTAEFIQPTKKKVKLSPKEFELIECFHDAVFQKFASAHLVCSFFKRQSVRFNPLIAALYPTASSWQIDFMFMKSIVSGTSHKTFDHLEFDDYTKAQWQQRYKDAIVSTPYRQTPMNYLITEVDFALNPSCPLDCNNKETFGEYYKRSYKCDIHDNQPLLHSVYAPSDTRFLCPSKDNNETVSKGRSRKRRTEYLIPQLCPLDEYPASLYVQAICLPSILFRLKAVINALELRQMIASGMARTISLTCPLNLDQLFYSSMNTKQDNENENENENQNRMTESCDKFADVLREKFHNKKSISSCPITLESVMCGMTSRSAQAGYDSECLEVLGDSFLKQAVTIYLYTATPSNNEFYLSKSRMAMIRNKTLWKNACDNRIPPFIIDNNLYAEMGSHDEDGAPLKSSQIYKYRWLLPGYIDTTDEHYKSNMTYIPKQELSDKKIADCVEALIGAALIDGDALDAMAFMKWMKLDTFHNKNDPFTMESSYANYPLPPSAAFNCELNNAKVRDIFEQQKLTILEEQIGYKFKDKSYLIQAMTHPSYYHNNITISYEQLEFLGDALLDFLVSYFIVNYYGHVLPGRLTDLRQALVNNNTFGLLAIQNRFNKHLLYLDSTVFQSMKSTVESLPPLDSDDYNCLFKNPFVLFLSENEVLTTCLPKCLGDVFESVAGAVFLDSGLNLVTLWNVYYPMMKHVIEKYLKDLPCHPVRQLMEFDANAKFRYEDNNEGGQSDSAYMSPSEACVAYIGEKSVRVNASNRKTAKAGAAFKLLEKVKTNNRGGQTKDQQMSAVS